jgi:hypothetical protein
MAPLFPKEALTLWKQGPCCHVILGPPKSMGMPGWYAVYIFWVNFPHSQKDTPMFPFCPLLCIIDHNPHNIYQDKYRRNLHNFELGPNYFALTTTKKLSYV